MTRVAVEIKTPLNSAKVLYTDRIVGTTKMKDPRKQRAKEITKLIHDVLWNDWDPIGVKDSAPEDEYDSYIGGVYRLLASRCSRETLVNHLLGIELDTMGLGPVAHGSESKHRSRLEIVADKLLAIDVVMMKE